LPVFHRWKQIQKLRAKMGATDALGISGNCQKGKDRSDADHLEKRLRE
jgi:hypothetical protein